jgi:hypothetical protein
LKDLGEIMDALKDLEELEVTKRNLETSNLEHEKALKSLDDSWRKRYRERFFDGDVSVPDFVDDDINSEDDPADISIEDYLNDFMKGGK